MARPDPIQYAERLYGAIRAANFSPISFLTFGNAVKDGVDLRRMPRIAAEPFMRVVGEMLDLEEEVAREDDVSEAEIILESEPPVPAVAPVPGEPAVAMATMDSKSEAAAEQVPPRAASPAPNADATGALTVNAPTEAAETAVAKPGRRKGSGVRS